MASQREQSYTAGKKHRDHAGRVEQCMWKPDRHRDPLAILRVVARTRLRSLLPIKIERMAVSPFAFFRGAAPIMAFDLAKMPVSGIKTQICGDAHVSNLGSFEAPDGSIIFDINDFDESVVAPWEWDLKRLVVSLVLAGREANQSARACVESVLRFAHVYRSSMHSLTKLTVLDLHRSKVHRELNSLPIESVFRKAQRATPLETLRRLVRKEDKSRLRFIEQRPLQFRVSRQEERQVIAAIGPYRETLSPERQHLLDSYRPEDVVFRVVGSGSVGLRDYVVLLLGRDDDDPLFLQVKEEQPPCYAPYLSAATGVGHQGRRVVIGQRMLQAQSDFLLGWTSVSGHDYLVRQLNDHKATVEIRDLKGDSLPQYAALCGELFAKAHARAGDPCLIAGYLGTSAKFDDALSKFAAHYADQVERDYTNFLVAHKRHTSIRARR